VTWISQSAGKTTVPAEPIEADSAAAALSFLPRGIDLVFLDAAVPADQRRAVLSGARGAAKPPFLVLLDNPETGAVSDCDGLASRPAHANEAQRLVERAVRLRKPSRVLIVDDSRTMRGIVRKILAATRFPLEVSEAGEGLAAIKLVREGGYDIIFLDYTMPEFNGIETLAELKREQRRADVVMMSTLHDEALAERARVHGATAFLKKPFYPADIDAVMCHFYGLRALNSKRR
jgi:CheY-like chemotaxis protein